MRRRLLWIPVLLLAVVAIVKLSERHRQLSLDDLRALGIDRTTTKAQGASADKLPPRRALGQMIVARPSGTHPSRSFLNRIERGEIGGVILFDENLRGGDAQIDDLIDSLQSTARRGGNPRLLIMVDQEGGEVKRLSGPPSTSASAMSSAGQARQQGRATGARLHALGIDVDLAPVADVGHPGTFLGSRVFASSPADVARRACAFAAGLRERGVAATLKHFPGLGLATENTDEQTAVVSSSKQAIRADYAPYRRCGSEPLTLVMVNSAIYPELSGDLPAVMSPGTYKRELPLAGATGVTISDDLEAPPIASQLTPARKSVNAGLDLLLYGQSESTSAYAFSRLLADVRDGRVDSGRIDDAASAILRLKQELSERQ